MGWALVVPVVGASSRRGEMSICCGSYTLFLLRLWSSMNQQYVRQHCSLLGSFIGPVVLLPHWYCTTMLVTVCFSNKRSSWWATSCGCVLWLLREGVTLTTCRTFDFSWALMTVFLKYSVGYLRLCHFWRKSPKRQTGADKSWKAIFRWEIWIMCVCGDCLVCICVLCLVGVTGLNHVNSLMAY